METIEQRRAQWEADRNSCEAPVSWGNSFDEHERNFQNRTKLARAYANARCGNFPVGEESEDWKEAWYSFCIGYASAMDAVFDPSNDFEEFSKFLAKKQSSSGE